MIYEKKKKKKRSTSSIIRFEYYLYFERSKDHILNETETYGYISSSFSSERLI